MMPTHTPTDEELKNQVIRQVLAGDTAGAQQTAHEIADTRYLRDAWQRMLLGESERGNVRAVNLTHASCPEPDLLASPFYLELPQLFLKAGDRSGAVEIAKAMGNAGVLPLIGIAAHMAQDGDMVGAHDALSHIEDEDLRAMILGKVIAYQPRIQRLDGINQVEAQAVEDDSLAA